MASATSQSAGRVVWHELMTPDVTGASRFYRELFGWTYEDVGMPTGPYRMIKAATGAATAGMMAIPAGAGFPPYWTSYVAVRDVDEVCAGARAQGGSVLWGPQDLPEVGRAATISDRQGAMITVFRGHGTADAPPPPCGPGVFCWETLNAADPAAERAFWTSVLPWSARMAHGVSVLVAGDAEVADVHSVRHGVHPSWITYVAVDDLTAARDRAIENGATVLIGESAVSGTGRISVIADPYGAVIGLLERERSAAE